MSNQNLNYTVQVESELEELIPGFLKNRLSDIQKITDSLQKSDFDAIKLIGHTMKGNGAGYGFNRISELGKSIESAAKEKHIAAIQELLNELSVYIDRVQIEYV